VEPKIKIGTVFGVELGLHYSWIVLAVLIAFSLASHFRAVNRDWTESVIWASALLTSVLFFGAIIVHELSHAMIAKMRGLPVSRITLFMLGGAAQIEKEPTDPKTEFWMAIAGPITSMVIGFGLLGVALVAGWSRGAVPATPGQAILVWLGYINIVLAVFNMLPGFPLDGGRVLRAIIWWINKDAARSTRIAVRVGQVVAVLFIVIGIYEVFGGLLISGMWMAFLGWFLLQAANASLMQSQAVSLLRNFLVRDLMTPEWNAISPATSVEDLVHQAILRTGARFFLVIDQGTLLGIVTPMEIRELDRSLWPQTPVRAIMIPTEKIHSVTPDAPAMRALEIMGRENVGQVPVIANGRVAGVVSRRHLLELMQVKSELGYKTSMDRAA
jgi:Zn-dependent protease/predicted transcriptional regulator